MVGNQRVRHQGEYLIKDEKCEQAAREGDADRGTDGYSETNEKPRLVDLFVPTHVPNGVGGVQYPQPRGNHSEQHA